MKEFADELGVSQGIVSRYEAGQATPGFAVLFKLYGMCDESMARERAILLNAFTDALGVNREQIYKWINDAHRQVVGRVKVYQSLKRHGDDPLAEMITQAVSDRRVVEFLQYWASFHSDPQMDAHLAEAVRTLSLYRESYERIRAQKSALQSTFGNLSEKEVEQLTDLLYLIRRGDPEEVSGMVRRAAAYRRQMEESERKRTAVTKPSLRDRR